MFQEMLSRWKFRIILGIFLAVFLMMGWVLFHTRTKTYQQSSVFPTATLIPVTPTPFVDEYVTISGVRIRNVLTGAQELDVKGHFLVLDSAQYQLFYFHESSSFFISVLASPFEKERVIAEKEFLSLLGIAQTDACRLSVSITTPYFVNPNESGKTYHLEGCHF